MATQARVFAQKIPSRASITQNAQKPKQQNKKRQPKKGKRRPKYSKASQKSSSLDTSRLEVQSFKQMWIPKTTLANIQARDKSHLVKLQVKNAHQSRANQCCVVPEKLLKAQGYYEGQASLWVPKALLQEQMPEAPSRTTKLLQQPKLQQKWRQKRNVSTKSMAPPIVR